MSRHIFGNDRESYEPARDTLRSTGNLSYLEFIRLVIRIWQQAHPNIPILPTGGPKLTKYPCIIYSLELRKVHPSEPKPRYRETRYSSGENAEIIMGQRFQNVINFVAVTETDPIFAEELIETFEDFIIEYTSVFKELGLSEIMYGRRISDDHMSRQGPGVTMRGISYLVTTEKLVVTEHERLNEITIMARRWLSSDNLLYSTGDRGTVYDSSPRFYLYGDDAGLVYTVTQDDIDEAIAPDSVVVRIPGTNFRIGDRIYIDDLPEATPSDDVLHGMYLISSIVDYQPYSPQMGYILEKTMFDGATPSSVPVVIDSPSQGLVHYIPDGLYANIIDTHEGI